jgi:Bardet-Biedl syndrome 7 protein
MVLCYKSTFLGTLLHLRISDGLIEVKTDNLSVLAIIKDSVSASAGQRKLKLNIEMTQVEMESVNIIIDSIYPKVQNQYTVAQRYQLIDGLKELAAGEDDLSYLSAEYKDILDQADSIRKSFTEQPKMLSYLWTVLTDLYGDMKKI